MSARRPPTPAEAQRIELIVREVKFTLNQEVTWNGHKEEGRALCKAISGYKPKCGGCVTGETKVLNILAEAVGLPAFAHEVSEERKQRRLAVCVTCPAYHIKTESCGRLMADALSPKPILIDGTEVNPCGCYLPLKTKFKHSQCPANKWH